MSRLASFRELVGDSKGKGESITQPEIGEKALNCSITIIQHESSQISYSFTREMKLPWYHQSISTFSLQPHRVALEIRSASLSSGFLIVSPDHPTQLRLTNAPHHSPMIRPLEGVEKMLSIQASAEFVQLALKVSTSSVIPKVISNFRKLFKIGLCTKIVNDAFWQRDTIPHIVKIPGWIGDCESACQWIFQNHTLPLSDGLCTIAAGDHLIAVNAHHTVADGRFLLRSFRQCLSDSVREPPLFPQSIDHFYRREISESMQTKPVIFPYRDCSSFPVFSEERSAPYDLRTFRLRFEDLACFDQKEQIAKCLTESLWIAQTFALGTRGKSIDTLAIPVITDLRKYVDPGRITNACLNHVGSVNLSAKTAPNMKLSDIGKQFRLDLQRYEIQRAPFYFSNVQFAPTPGRCYGISSNIGTFRVNPPIEDVYVTSLRTGTDFPVHIAFYSFLKMAPHGNEICGQIRFSPGRVPVKDAHIILESVKHFLTKIPLSATVADAYSQMSAFQAHLDKTL
jgi:hypothetical protein